MIYAIYGALGALYTLALLGFGFWCGWHLRIRFRDCDAPGVPASAGEQSAFEEMLRYNLNTAYGMEEGGDGL